MKILVTGGNGQLGSVLCKELETRGHNVICGDLTPCENEPSRYLILDITDRMAVLDAVTRLSPDAVIHCAAWTNVDSAEDPANRERVFAVNADGTRNLAFACAKAGCKMLYISTDYVFNGSGDEPWQADCTEFSPLNYYGLTKLEGERAVAETLQTYFIVRIAWLFGNGGKNFADTMLKLSDTHDILRVVNDQIGTPTYAPDLACLLADMIVTDRYGIYHATNEGGFVSWYEYACEIFRQAGKKVTVIPVSTADYGQSLARRPLNSRLDKQKLTENGFARLPAWKDALARYLKERIE